MSMMTRARADSRRPCLRIRCRRGCIPEEYGQRGGPGHVLGIRRLRLDARFGSRNCRCEKAVTTHFFASPDHLHGDAAIDLRMAVVQDSGAQFAVGQMTGVAGKAAAS